MSVILSLSLCLEIFQISICKDAKLTLFICMRRECRGAVGSGWCSVCYLTIGYGFRGSSRKYTNLSGGMKSDAFLFYSEVRKYRPPHRCDVLSGRRDRPGKPCPTQKRRLCIRFRVRREIGG